MKSKGLSSSRRGRNLDLLSELKDMTYENKDGQGISLPCIQEKGMAKANSLDLRMATQVEAPPAKPVG